METLAYAMHGRDQPHLGSAQLNLSRPYQISRNFANLEHHVKLSYLLFQYEPSTTMSKRFAEAEDDAREVKRPKTHAPGSGVIPATDIWSARELQNLLSFSQDAVQQLRTGEYPSIG